MPPLGLRDGLEYTMDLFLAPINWLVLPLIEIQGVPSAIAHKNRTTTFMIRLGRQAEEVTNDCALNLEKFQGALLRLAGLCCDLLHSWGERGRYISPVFCSAPFR